MLEMYANQPLCVHLHDQRLNRDREILMMCDQIKRYRIFVRF